jgi:hypothetical protein
LKNRLPTRSDTAVLPNYEMVEFVCENNREYIDEQGRVRMKVGGAQK